MLAVKADWAARKIPANYFMFDSWWYQKDGDPGANATHPWPVRSTGGMVYNDLDIPKKQQQNKTILQKNYKIRCGVDEFLIDEPKKKNAERRLSPIIVTLQLSV